MLCPYKNEGPQGARAESLWNEVGRHDHGNQPLTSTTRATSPRHSEQAYEQQVAAFDNAREVRHGDIMTALPAVDTGDQDLPGFSGNAGPQPRCRGREIRQGLDAQEIVFLWWQLSRPFTGFCEPEILPIPDGAEFHAVNCRRQAANPTPRCRSEPVPDRHRKPATWQRSGNTPGELEI